ncbi:transposase, partial [Escherichia coli]|nr:transposase [Escherichia coli]
EGRSAIRLYNRFPHIRKKLWGNHFWSRGYSVDTVGVNEEIIRRDVRHQEKMEQTHEQPMELPELKRHDQFLRWQRAHFLGGY